MNLFVFTWQIVKVGQQLNVWHTCPVNHINTREVDSFSHHLISFILLSLSLALGYTRSSSHVGRRRTHYNKEDTKVVEGLFDLRWSVQIGPLWPALISFEIIEINAVFSESQCSAVQLAPLWPVLINLRLNSHLWIEFLPKFFWFLACWISMMSYLWK